MKFTHLPQVARFIDKHHTVFGCPFASTLTVLGNLNRQIMETATVGATFRAWLKADDGSEIKTYITIEKNPAGWWDYTEKVA